MATNEPPKNGQDCDLGRRSGGKPSNVLRNQQQRGKVMPDSANHVTLPIRAQKGSTNVAKDPQIKIYKSSNCPQDAPQLKPEVYILDGYLSQSDLKQLEMVFFHNRYPDVYLIKELSERLNVSRNIIVQWFEIKRSEIRKIQKHMAYQWQEQAFQLLEQQLDQQYNQQLLAYRHQAISQSAAMPQASGSMNYLGQQPAGQYLTAQHLNYLEYLFTAGIHYPDMSRLAAKLNVPQQHLATWFEQRHHCDARKKEQVNSAYTSMKILEQQNFQQLQQRQQQSSTGGSQVSLCSEASILPEAANVPLFEKILSDVANKPSLSLLEFPDKF